MAIVGRAPPLGGLLRPLGWWVFLGLLLLLPHSARGEAPWSEEEEGGEWCRVSAFPARVFLCPGREHEPSAKFCCGTCGFPYCCSSREFRLDQNRCSRGGPGVTEEPLEVTPASKKEKSAYKWTILFALIFFFFGIAFLLAVYHCQKRYWPWLRTYWFNNTVQIQNGNQNQDEPREVFPTGLYFLPDIPDPVLRPLPPNVTVMPPNPDNPEEKWAFSPAACAEFFQSGNADNMEGEAATGSLVHRHIPSQSSDVISEKETSL